MATDNAIDPRFDANPTLPGVADPYPIFHAVREADPVHWCPGAKLWAVMRYDDAETVLKNPHLSRQAYLDALEARSGRQPITEMQRHELVFTDNPVHGKLRHIIGEAINAHAVSDLKGKIDALVDEKLSPLLKQGKMDVIGDFLLTLPTSAGAAWLGIPDEDRQRITEWIFPLVSGRGVARDAKSAAAASDAAIAFRKYFDNLAKNRRAKPTGDLFSHLLIAQAEDPSQFTDDVMFGLIVAIFAAGHAPGVSLMAHTLLALVENPQKLQRVRDEPGLLPSCIEEGLRFVSPTQAINPLAAMEDIPLRGKTIRKGEALTVIIASANRDPEVFADPDRFDADRSPNRHVAFSMGVHYCLGSILSKDTAHSALGALVRKLADIKLGCDRTELKWVSHDRFRTLAALPISFRAA